MISVLFIGSLYWSSSWWWEPHMSGSEIFGPLLRAGLVDLDQFFLQNVNFIYVLVVQKNFGAFSRCSCPLNWSFFRGGAFFQNWGAGPSILEMGSFTNAFSLAPSFELFHWIFCMISHCLWSIYIRLCSFHFSDTNMTTFTWIGIFIIWIDSLSRSQMALL